MCSILKVDWSSDGNSATICETFNIKRCHKRRDWFQKALNPFYTACPRKSGMVFEVNFQIFALFNSYSFNCIGQSIHFTSSRPQNHETRLRILILCVNSKALLFSAFPDFKSFEVRQPIRLQITKITFHKKLLIKSKVSN